MVNFLHTEESDLLRTESDFIIFLLKPLKQVPITFTVSFECPPLAYFLLSRCELTCPGLDLSSWPGLLSLQVPASLAFLDMQVLA